MKKIYFMFSFLIFINMLKAQAITGIVLNTNFEHEVVSNSQHKFKFHTFFSLGHGLTCPNLINPEFTIFNDILYVKGYYNITGAWPSSFCDRIDYVYYNYQIPENVTQIITSTNIIAPNNTPPYIPDIITHLNIYTHTFILNLSSNS